MVRKYCSAEIQHNGKNINMKVPSMPICSFYFNESYLEIRDDYVHYIAPHGSVHYCLCHNHLLFQVATLIFFWLSNCELIIFLYCNFCAKLYNSENYLKFTLNCCTGVKDGGHLKFLYNFEMLKLMMTRVANSTAVRNRMLMCQKLLCSRSIIVCTW